MDYLIKVIARAIGTAVIIHPNNELSKNIQFSSKADFIVTTLTSLLPYSIIGIGGFIMASTVKVINGQDKNVRQLWF